MYSSKQQVIGIVAEYNPFHNGHAWQIEQARRIFPQACIVAVMSGNFVQRGQPAVLDKWSRAKLAVDNGVDLVLELPFSFACRSAEHFARGSIGILNAIGIIDHLVFGAEADDIKALQALAAFSLDARIIATLKEYMKSGLSYPQALAKSLSNKCTQSELISSPNNILAIEYLKQLLLINSNIKPQLIVRHIAGYKDISISGNIASATAIREQLAAGISQELELAIPPATLHTLQQAELANALIHADNPALSLLTIYKLRSCTAEYLREHTDVSEGLEHKIRSNANEYNTLSALTPSLVNKRYPYSRISRILLQALVGMSKSQQPTYIRPLAFNNTGRQLLTIIKIKSALPIVAKLGRDFTNLPLELRACPVLTTEINASNVYQMLLTNNSGVHNLDFLKSPQYID